MELPPCPAELGIKDFPLAPGLENSTWANCVIKGVGHNKVIGHGEYIWAPNV